MVPLLHLKMDYILKNRVAEYRTAQKIKKWQLAHRLGMSRPYVTRLEHGDIQPSLKTALRIAKCLGKPVEEIFKLVEDGGNQLASAARALEASASEAHPKSNFPASLGSVGEQTSNKAETVKG